MKNWGQRMFDIGVIFMFAFCGTKLALGALVAVSTIQVEGSGSSKFFEKKFLSVKCPLRLSI